MSDNNIKLELPLPAVDVILQALAKAPYEQVADLIQTIRMQAIPQLPLPETASQEAARAD